MTIRRFFLPGILTSLIALSGCGGGGGGGGDSPPSGGGGPTLVSIAVTPSASSIANGTTKQFSATGRYSDNSTTDVTQSAVWSSLNTTVTTISSTTGLATGKTPGIATISAAYSGLSGTALLTVTGAELVSFSITPPHPSIAKGLKQQFTATGTFTDGSSQDITSSAAWDSSQTSIATIDPATGFATSVNQGTATISAVHSSLTATALMTVTAAELVSFSITPPNPSVAKGLKQQFTATGTFTDGSILEITSSTAWASSNSFFATISATGLASSQGVGTSTITAVSSALIETTLLTVTPAEPVSLSLSPPSALIANGKTQQYTATATLTDSSTPDVTSSATWDSSDPAVATITAPGIASSKAPGTTTISAVYSGLTATAPLTITTASLVSLSISPSSASIAKGLTQPFTATGHFSDNSSQDVTLSAQWDSSQPLVSTISSTGLAISVDQGTTTISAVHSGQTATAQLTVTAAVPAHIDVTPINPILRLNATQQFTATMVFTDATTSLVTDQVDWASSDTGIATITTGGPSRGLASPVNMGTAIISAKDAGSGLTGTTLVLVRAYVTLPDTGQTGDYTATFGEDSDYTINPPSYMDNGDGTTTDLHTGLLWQQHDDGIAKSWTDADSYCQILNLAGTGWRLPTRRELMTILDLGVPAPKINGTYFPGTQVAEYWSSDPGGTSLVLAADFDTGRLISAWLGAQWYVRCVRGTQLIPSIFSNNNDGTIIDYATGLMWQQGENSTMYWNDALNLCEGLSLGNHNDWRLPNAKELESLIFGTGNPSIDMGFFPNAQGALYWTSTTCTQSPSNAYTVNYSDRTSSCIDKTLTPSYVRCVRGGY